VKEIRHVLQEDAGRAREVFYFVETAVIDKELDVLCVFVGVVELITPFVVEGLGVAMLAASADLGAVVAAFVVAEVYGVDRVRAVGRPLNGRALH